MNLRYSKEKDEKVKAKDKRRVLEEINCGDENEKSKT